MHSREPTRAILVMLLQTQEDAVQPMAIVVTQPTTVELGVKPPSDVLAPEDFAVLEQDIVETRLIIAPWGVNLNLDLVLLMLASRLQEVIVVQTLVVQFVAAINVAVVISGYCGNGQEYCSDPGNCLRGGYGRCDSDATPAGPSTLDAPRPLKGPVSYTADILDCVQDKVVALTYDDGPYKYTADLLDVLKTYGFQATFFITGNNNGKGEIDITAPYPALIQRMIAEGHQVASHTWSHYSLSNISHDLRMQQMVKNEMAFNNIIGKWPTYMRPPYSDCTEASGCWADMKTLGYHRVYFDLDTQDYLNPLPSQIQNSKDIVQKALALNGPTDYLSIQHDIIQQSVGNLSSYYFDQIKAKGWKGVTVGECLGDTDRTNWYRTLNTPAVSSQSASGSASVTTSSTSPSIASMSAQGSAASSTLISSATSSATTSKSMSTVPSSVKSSTTSAKTSTSSTNALYNPLSTMKQLPSVAVPAPAFPSTPAALPGNSNRIVPYDTRRASHTLIGMSTPTPEYQEREDSQRT
ncbi:hypothetical protein NHQ30_004993 [Ciborinia camelliae]|nr:hypothetical protein NHQ30_004993 [Ciborinia camelliae]